MKGHGSILPDQSRSLKSLEKSSLASCGQSLVQTFLIWADRILKYKWWKLRSFLVLCFPHDNSGTGSMWSQTCMPGSRCLPADELLQLCQPVTLQCFPDRVEKSKVVFKVVYHKQDPGQQFIGHQQVVNVSTSVVLTAVTGTPSHQWAKVLLVPEKGS